MHTGRLFTDRLMLLTWSEYVRVFDTFIGLLFSTFQVFDFFFFLKKKDFFLLFIVFCAYLVCASLPKILTD